MLSLLILPFIACLILTAIHTYLGLHVVRRGVIFVDLALAQLAALGSTIALLFGFDLHDPEAYFFSLGMTFLGAAFFSLSRPRREVIPHEAIIGVTYAVSTAASLIVLDQVPGGAEHIRSLLVGNILTVSEGEILKTALLYAAVGIFHWRYRKPMMAISFNLDQAITEAYRIRGWDFLFYMTFGLVVTSSVALAGVLLVFSYLIVPALISLIFTEDIRFRLAIGWGIGLLASLIGLYTSVALDTPTGASIVCAFGFLFFIFVLGKWLQIKKNEWRSIGPLL